MRTSHLITPFCFSLCLAACTSTEDSVPVPSGGVGGTAGSGGAGGSGGGAGGGAGAAGAAGSGLDASAGSAGAAGTAGTGGFDGGLEEGGLDGGGPADGSAGQAGSAGSDAGSGKADGEVCTEASECESGYCQNGLCCASGDCCAAPEDCPDSYSEAPACTDETACQGSRRDAQCTEFTCVSSDPIDDDSACDDTVLSKECTPYPAVYCNGELVQEEPACGSTCTQDSECEDGYHCDSTCQPDLVDGFPCDEASDCGSGHCQNGFCCASGDCCSAAVDCPDSYAQAALCTSASTCQGSRHDAQCVASVCMMSDPIGDDSACAGMLADTCGTYPSVFCSDQQDQSAPQCPVSCATDNGCDADAHCDANVCVPDQAAGQGCNELSDCQAGLYCIDGVCCTSSCTGLCMACNVAGSLGICSAVPAGQDPANECAGFNCDGFYWGWAGDTCYDRADAAGSAVSCDGAGQCRTQADVCSTRGQGDATLTCHATCQSPDGSTCTGTTPGSCYNLSGGKQTCGTGECEVTVNQCSGGTPLTCQPSAPSPETCNNLDDDCNGTVDDNVSGAADSYANTCSSATNLGTVGESSSEMSWTGTIYPSGDKDFFRFYAEEGAHTCFPGTDQDYTVRVRLVPPHLEDCQDYDLRLYDDSCTLLASSAVSGCSAETINFTWDGACGGNDSRYFRVEVLPYSGAWECVSYTLSINMWQVP